jgi:hypothetical protein
VQVTDLPPIPVIASGDPGDLTPALDEDRAPIVGPRLGVQWSPPLGLPPVHPPEQPGGFPESLSAPQELDLIAFLQGL